MRRIATSLVLVLGLVGVAVFGVAAEDGGGGGYKVRAIFDDVASAVPGEDVKVAGARVGRIGKMEVTPEHKAAVVLEITDSGFAPFHSDARCTIRPQSLIGEKYVECDPGSPSRPELREIGDGPGEGQHLLPVKNTSSPVDLDLVNNIMRLPYRQRFAILLNEFGAALAGRGEDLNELIHRANPALRETNRVLKILGDENDTLERLAVSSDRALAPLARDRRHLSGFIREANEVAEATAERRADIERSIERFPRFLRELKPTMEELGAFADEMSPVLSDLDRAAPSLNRLVVELGPFSRSATTSLRTLGEAADVGGPVLQRARPVVRDLKAFANSARPVAEDLDEVTASLDRTGGLEQFMNYIFFQMTAVNGFDEISHYLRASLLVNVCSTYVTTQAPGCGAHFSETESVRSSSASRAEDPTVNLANGGNAPETREQTASTQLKSLAQGLLNLAAEDDTPADAQREAQLREIRERATKGTSPALEGAGGEDEQLLGYLMGNGE